MLFSLVRILEDGLFDHAMEYGIDAFLHTLLWNLISFSVVIPVLPISLLYIIIYLIINKREKKK